MKVIASANTHTLNPDETASDHDTRTSLNGTDVNSADCDVPDESQSDQHQDSDHLSDHHSSHEDSDVAETAETAGDCLAAVSWANEITEEHSLGHQISRCNIERFARFTFECFGHNSVGDFSIIVSALSAGLARGDNIYMMLARHL